MTRTTIPTDRPPNAATGSDIQLLPSDILMNLIVACLAPMFLSVSGGDIGFARMAAIETVNAYRARNQMDLIAIAQIIGFGLAALGSLSLSMADDISLSMTLRLRGNANALNRSAEQNRRALTKSRGEDPMPHHAETAPEAETPPVTSHEDLNDGALAVEMASAQKLAAAAPPRRQAEQEPAIQPPAPAPASTAAAQMTAENRHQAMWAIAIVKEAGEITASIPNLPVAERKAAAIRAGVLSSTANELLTGASTPRTIPHGRGTQGPSNTA
jgi:hypothetical protein